MSATEVLRRILDERGVEWMDVSPFPSMKPWKTSYVSFTGEEITLSCYDEPKWIMGTMVFHTPEQAIAATLGSCNCSNSERTGTCTADETERFECLDSRYKSFDYNPYITVHVMECSKCGGTYEHVNGGYEFCPRCGRKVVDQ